MEKIRTQIEKDRLAIRPSAEGGFEAYNPRTNYTVHFTGDGATFSKAGDTASAWRFGMSLARYGYSDRLQALGAGTLQADGDRVSYRRRQGVEEWYVNTPSGVEQGFTLERAPQGEQPGDLVFDIAVYGSLSPRASEDGNRLLLCDASGSAVLTYGKLKAYDAAGRELPATMMTLAGPDRQTIRLRVDDTGAVYPIVVDPLVQGAKLTAADAEFDDRFGYSVSISGDLVIVGAYSDYVHFVPSGSAYIFYKDQGGTDNWGQVKKLTAADAAAGDYFGYSVSISGNLAIVGAYRDDDGGSYSGSAYIFSKDQGGTDNWGQVKKLTAADPAADDLFGYSVSISGNLAIVGAPWDDDGGTDSGSAYIFNKDQGGTDNWGQVKKLTADAAVVDRDYFGWSVSISGNLAIIGAYSGDDGVSYSGSAYIFGKDQGGTDNWGQVKKLTAADAAVSDYFGWSVSISGSLAIVGAYRDDDGGSSSGSAYIFGKDQGGTDNWGQVQKLTAADAAADDNFGWAVSISGDLAIVGAPYDDDDGTDSGSAYIFGKDQGGTDNWGQVQKLTAADAAADDYFGRSVSISGDLAIVGAYGNDDRGIFSGSAYIFNPEKIQVTPTSGLSVTEAGGTDTFTIVLATEPTADVTIALSSSDTGEGAVSPASLTFTAANWNTPQTVTITGVDDDSDDGDQGFSITTAAAVSTDGNYSGLNPSDVSVTCTDDDSADSDGDGIPDSIEGSLDTDGDGTPDYQDTDSDNDGISDAIEGSSDTDSDGLADYLDTEADGDGVSDEVENGAPNNGDGNNDGIPDRLQNRVTTLMDYNGTDYVTLEAPEGTTLADVQAIDDIPTEDMPAGSDLTYGLYEFTINNVEPGGSVQLTLYLPEGAQPDSYLKYGPTPDNEEYHWYEFVYDGTVGAEINANVITLHFVDGEEGDDILAPDGMVVDAGGPMVDAGSPSSGCFMGCLKADGHPLDRFRRMAAGVLAACSPW